MISIAAKMIDGHGLASTSMQLQLPYFQKYYAELENCHAGTINLLLDVDLIVFNPDFSTAKISWHPEYPPEKFDFLRIRLHISKAGNEQKEYDAWIYMAEKSPHKNIAGIQEVICQKIDGIQRGDEFKLFIDHDDKPYFNANNTLTYII